MYLYTNVSKYENHTIYYHISILRCVWNMSSALSSGNAENGKIWVANPFPLQSTSRLATSGFVWIDVSMATQPRCFVRSLEDVMICECFQCFRCFVGAAHFAFLDKNPPVWCMSNLEIHETGFLIWKIKQLRSWNWNYTHYSKKKYRVKSSETEAPSKSFSAGEIVTWYFPLSPPVQWWHWACPRRALPFDPTSMRAKVETLKHNKATNA